MMIGKKRIQGLKVIYRYILDLGFKLFLAGGFSWLGCTMCELPCLADELRQTPGSESLKSLRIGSSTIGGDEMLWLILSEARALERLVAVSYLADKIEYSRLSTEFRKVPYRIGSGLESLVRSRPELVILASFNRPELLQQVSNLGIKSLILPEFRKLDDIVKALQDIGRFIGEEKAAESIRRRFVDQVEIIRQRGVAFHSRLPRPRVLAYSLDHSVIGTQTLADEMIDLSGGVNVLRTLGVEGWPKLGVEALMRLEVDHVVTGALSSERQKILSNLKSDPASAGWKASRLSSVTLLDPKQLNSISPFIIEALEQIQKDLFPLESKVTRGKM